MTEKMALPTWIDSVAKAVGLVGSLSLVSSFIYDWGFFYALNISFAEAPTSLADHIRSTLTWVPNAAIGLGALLIFELATRRIEQGMTEEEIITSSPYPGFTRMFRGSPYWVILVVAVLILLSYLLFGDTFFPGLQFALIVVWLAFSMWVSGHSRILQRRPRMLILAIHWLPAVAIWLWFIGYNDAESRMRTVPPRGVVYVKGVSQEAVPANLLRTFDRGVLIKSLDRSETIFVSWADVGKIEIKYQKRTYRGILCDRFGVCLEGKPAK